MKAIVPFPVLLLSIILFGCSDNFPESKIKEINSGTYHLSGIQIELTYDFPWPSWGGEEVILSRDTTHIEFTVEIEYPSSRMDTVRFEGLEGADAGEYRSTYEGGCSFYSPSCYANASMKDGELSFDLSVPSGSYTGSGILKGEKLILETHFEYRSTGIDYHLQGEKLDD